MTSTPGLLIKDLAELIGLDQETIKSQIWPMLSTMKSSVEVSIYLQELLGSSPASLGFITTYTNSRFPSNNSNSNESKSRSNTPIPSNNSNTNHRFPQSSSSSNQNQNQNQIEQQRRALIEREFEGSGGKVYLKNRGDEDFMGSGKRSNSRGTSPAGSRGGSGSVTPVPVATNSSNSNGNSQSGSMLSSRLDSKKKVAPSKEKEKVPEENVLVPLSNKATIEMLEIDRLLKTFEKSSTTTKVRECFCQARQHELSPYTPLCNHCSIVLCELNSPSSPCPSCSHSPLLSPTASENFINNLKSRRDLIIQSETLRIIREKVEEQEERAAIRFPTLGEGIDRHTGSGTGRNYSNIAGAGPGIDNNDAERFHQNSLVNNGRSVNTIRKAEPSNNGAGRVLKLDMKTKKVKIQTKVVKKVLKEVIKQPEGGNQIVFVENQVEEDEEDFGSCWIDENDDGYAARSTNIPSSKMKDSTITEERPFINLTLDENSRPIWTEEIVREEVEEVVVNVENKKDSKHIVPGAAIRTEGDAKKKSRSKVKKGTGLV